MNEHPEAIEPPDENVKAEPSADAAEGADAGGAAVDAAAEADPIDAAPAGDDAVDGEPAGDEPAGDESAEAESAGDEPAGGEPELAATGDDVAGDEEKAPSAYRTISEVSVSLDVPQHVLRFWETKFAQLRPMKRGGGRRYYRPEDVALLKLVKGWLYDEGLTIKGVQKRLKGRGMRQALTEEGELPEVAPPKPRKRLPPLPEPVRQEIGDILTELRAIRAELGTQ